MVIKREGIILLEVIVSLSILSFGLLALTRSFSGSLRAASYIHDHTLAALLAQREMAGILSNPYLSTGITTGDFGDEYPRYRWRREITSTAGKMNQVTVTVFWERREKKSRFTLDTLTPKTSLVEGLE